LRALALILEVTMMCKGLKTKALIPKITFPMKHFLLYGLLLCAATTLAQTPAPLLRVYESKLYNAADPAQHLIKNNGIAEINGTLLVQLDQTGIRQRMQTFAGVRPADISLVSKYKSILAQKTETLQLLQEGLAASKGQPDFKKLASLSQLMDDFYTTLLSDPELRNLAAQADAEYTQKVSAGSIDPDSYTDDMYFIEFFGKKANEVLDQINTTDNVRFILTGAMYSEQNGTRTVTLGSDFDNIPEEIYEVPRWTFSLSDDQKKELRDVALVAQKLDSLRNSTIKSTKSAYFSALSCKACFDNLKIQIQQLPTSVEGLKDTAVARAIAVVKPLQDQLVQLQDKYFQIPTSAQGLNVATELSAFNNDLTQLDAFSKSYFKGLPTALEQLPLSLRNTPQVQAVKALIDSCQTQVKRDIRRFYILLESLKSVLGGSGAERQFHNAISDQVKRLAIADVPTESFVDLNKTGKRANGDELILEAYLELEGGSGAGAAKRQSVYRQNIVLQQIALYSEVKVNMILANPVPDLANQRREYMFAPSYSVLFRWGSRKSRFYNDFVNIGIGANFSAPDFNLDGVPEFAVAGTFSTFKDFLSVGYGYNFGADAPYMFIGFRVPFASAALPILNNVEK
jgi:hypothetical protein